MYHIQFHEKEKFCFPFTNICFSSHGNLLFSSPHPLDFNMLVILGSKNNKWGHKRELA